MKAHEILNEYEWKFGSDNSNSIDPLSAGALAAGGKLAAKAGNKIKGAVAGKGKPTAATPAKPSTTDKATRFAKYKETQKGKVAAIENKWSRSVGRGWTLAFSAMSLITPIAQLLADLEKTKAARDSGELTPEEYEEARQFHVGVFQTQLLVPAVARLVINVSMVAKILKAFKNLAALISAPATAGLSIAAAFATDAAILWAQQWLGSDEGKEWLSTYLLEVITSWGSVGTNIYDEIVKKYQALQKR